MIELGKFIIKNIEIMEWKISQDWQKKDNNYIFGRKFEFVDFSKANLTNQK